MARESASGRADWQLAGLAPGTVVAGYRLEARIGAGGMAVVFRARDRRLGRTVALKVLAPALAGDQEFRERFIRESRAAAAVDHPHIIPVYDAGEAAGILYLAMRYVSGGDLRSVTRREGPLPPERAAFLLSPVASALDAAHAAGLVHRDVKPANVLVDMSPGRPDHPYLSDFGLAKATASGAGLTGTGQFLGTADYAAPEQIAGGRAHVHTDQYALACVAFTMLTGSPPFTRDQPMSVLWAHLNDPPPLAAQRRFDLSPAVDEVLGRALAKNPAARYPSCGAFADALRAALGAAAFSIPPPSHPGQPERRAPRKPAGRRRGALAVGAAALLAGAAVATAVLLRPEPAGPRHGSGAAPGGRATGLADSPNASAPPTSPDGAVTIGRPVPFVNPGSVPLAAVAFRPDGSLATVGVNDTAYVWDVTAHDETTEMAAPRGNEFVRAAFSPDGQTLAAQDTAGMMYVFRDAEAPIATLPGVGRLYPGSLSIGGLTTATADSARTGVDVWAGERSTPVEILMNPDHGAPLTSVAISADGKTMAASDDSGRTYLWDANTGTRTHVLAPADGSDVNCSVFSFSGALLVTGDVDGRAYLWNPATGRLLRWVRDTDGSVDTVAISVDGRLLATSGTGHTIHLWSAATGASLGTIADPGGAVSSLAFNVMDTRLAAAGENGTTYVWNL